jgi:hypothetical protein
VHLDTGAAEPWTRAPTRVFHGRDKPLEVRTFCRDERRPTDGRATDDKQE